ncbi:MAG: hypothetical protein V1799_07395 [bacterium]
MKILIDTKGVVVHGGPYDFEVGENSVIVKNESTGNTEFIVAYLNSTNASVVTDVVLPKDFVGGKYLYQAEEFILNTLFTDPSTAE